MAQRKLGLENIPKEEWTKLGERVKKAGGKLVLLVHPFYHWDTREGDMAKYQEVVEDLLRNSKTPVVILEEIKSLDRGRTEKILREVNAGDVLLIPTSSTGSALVRREDADIKDLYDFGIDSLAKRLKEAGVKSIYVGGIYAKPASSKFVREYEAGWIGRKLKDKKSRFEYVPMPFAIDCAGAVYRKLIKWGGFEKIRWIPNAKVNRKLKIGRARPYTGPPKPRAKRRAIH